MTATGGNENTRVVFKNCVPFTKPISNEHVDSANNLDIIMAMYNLIEHSDIYS